MFGVTSCNDSFRQQICPYTSSVYIAKREYMKRIPIMKSIKTILLASLILAGAFGTSAAQAHPGHFYGPRVGIYIDPWVAFYPWAAYPYPYGYGYSGYAPVIVAQPAAPTVYIEQAQQTAPAQSAQSNQEAQSSDWYYCRKPQGYYPYVRNCSQAWERVPAQPQMQAPAQ